MPAHTAPEERRIMGMTSQLFGQSGESMDRSANLTDKISHKSVISI